MFKTVLVIYYLTGHVNVIVRSQVWLQNGQRSNSSITATTTTTSSAHKNQSTDSSVNISEDRITAVLINVDTRGAPRFLNVSDSRSTKASERLSTVVNQRRTESRKVRKRSEEKLVRRLVYHQSTTTSNPKNDVEVFKPLEGASPAYGPRGTPVPQPPAAFPPSLPDYPAGVYPYEPPYYYPFYSNEIPSFQPYYPPVYPLDPALYPTSPPQLPSSVTRVRPDYADYTTAMRTHETEPTTPSTSEPDGRNPVKVPEPEIIVQRPRKKPISRTNKPTKSPNTSSFTSPRAPNTSQWPYFRAKSYTTTRSHGTRKFTAKRQTATYRTAATQPYTYGQYTTPASPIYNVWNYSPTTVDPRTVFYPWTTKKPPSIVPQAFYPYFAGNNVQGNAVVSAYQPYLGEAAVATMAVQIGGRATNRTSSERFRSGPWIPPTRKVEVVGAPSALDPKFKLATVSNYENFNETAGTFGFDIDLENGITVQIRGYKKNGTQILDGSFSLFTNEGEPVKIAYTADDEKEAPITSTTRGPDSKVPQDDGDNSTIEKDDVLETTTTTGECLDC